MFYSYEILGCLSLIFHFALYNTIIWNDNLWHRYDGIMTCLLTGCDRLTYLQTDWQWPDSYWVALANENEITCRPLSLCQLYLLTDLLTDPSVSSISCCWSVLACLLQVSLEAFLPSLLPSQVPVTRQQTVVFLGFSPCHSLTHSSNSSLYL